MFIAALFTIAMCWKQPKCPLVNEWFKILCCIYTMEYYAAERKKKLLPFTTAWMELESIMLSEINQERQIPYDLTYKWNLINKQTSKQNRTRDMEIKNKLIVTRGRGGGG